MQKEKREKRKKRKKKKRKGKSKGKQKGKGRLYSNEIHDMGPKEAIYLDLSKPVLHPPVLYHSADGTLHHVSFTFLSLIRSFSCSGLSNSALIVSSESETE